MIILMVNRSVKLFKNIYFKSFLSFARKGACRLTLLLSVSAAADADVIQVYTEEYPPFNFADANGMPTGQSTLLVQSMMKSAGLEYKITFVPWARALKFAAESKSSCVYSTSRTSERESRYHWIGPLVTNNWTVFGLATDKNKVKKVEDLKKEKVGSYIGDAIVHYLKERKVQVVEAQHDEVNISMLKTGRIKYWATGKLNGQTLLDKANEKSIVPLFEFNSTQMYLACSKHVDKSVIEKLQDAFKKIKPAH